jgi:penicillin-binding protein 1A
VAKPLDRKAKGARRGKPARTRAGAVRSRRFRVRFWPAFGWLARASAIAAAWTVVVAVGLTAWYATDLPDVDRAVSATRRPSVTILAADGAPIASFGDLYGRPLAAERLPQHLVNAVLATEDRRFRKHRGLDVRGLARAMWANVRAGAIVQGGSTITQQVAKNLFLSPERTLKRKVQELLLALWLERKFTKDQILAIYLNRVYFGAGAFGVDAAAQRYFGVRAEEIDLTQAAMLAGLLKAPSRYNPRNDPASAAKRAAVVLDAMAAWGAIEPGEAAAAKRGAKRGVRPVAASGRGRHFADWIFERASYYVSPGGRDLVVLTTLDAGLQDIAEASVANALGSDGAEGGGLGADQAAIVALALDGAVRAMVGGTDYRASQYNRATQALRQPGSAFKPIVYLAALAAGMEPETVVVDEPIAIAGWSPRNFDGRHIGPTTLRVALARSINTVAVRVAEQAGRARIIETARRLGITAPMAPSPSLSLGSFEVSVIELTAAYASFAAAGMGVWPYGITEIRDSHGEVLYRRRGSGPGRVMSAENAARMNAMLADAIREGTGRAARIARPAAGKTGTSQDHRDAWFVGYTGHLVAGVWVGNDSGAPMRGVTGGGLPARLWRDLMTRAHEGLVPKPIFGVGPRSPRRPPPTRASGPDTSAE